MKDYIHSIKKGDKDLYVYYGDYWSVYTYKTKKQRDKAFDSDKFVGFESENKINASYEEIILDKN